MGANQRDSAQSARVTRRRVGVTFGVLLCGTAACSVPLATPAGPGAAPLTSDASTEAPQAGGPTKAIPLANTLTVPTDLVGRQGSDAITRLEAMGLTVEVVVTPQGQAGFGPGRIVTVTPAPGTVVAPGGRITVFETPRDATVPTLVDGAPAGRSTGDAGFARLDWTPFRTPGASLRAPTPRPLVPGTLPQVPATPDAPPPDGHGAWTSKAEPTTTDQTPEARGTASGPATTSRASDEPSRPHGTASTTDAPRHGDQAASTPSEDTSSRGKPRTDAPGPSSADKPSGGAKSGAWTPDPATPVGSTSASDSSNPDDSDFPGGIDNDQGGMSLAAPPPVKKPHATPTADPSSDTTGAIWQRDESTGAASENTSSSPAKNASNGQGGRAGTPQDEQSQPLQGSSFHRSQGNPSTTTSGDQARASHENRRASATEGQRDR